MLQSLQEGAADGETGGCAPTNFVSPAGGDARGDCGECGGACDALSTFCPPGVGFNLDAAD